MDITYKHVAPSLTLEVARDLAALSRLLANGGLCVSGPLHPHERDRSIRLSVELSGMNSIDSDTAYFLAKCPEVELASLDELDPDVAFWLAKCFDLSLPALSDLDAHTARQLARGDGWLTLNGLQAITPEIASELAGHAGALVLSGLTELPLDVAVALAGHAGKCLYLHRVPIISEPVAQALAQHQGRQLVLRLLAPDQAVLAALNQHHGRVRWGPNTADYVGQDQIG